jgi:mannosyltransferase
MHGLRFCRHRKGYGVDKVDLSTRPPRLARVQQRAWVRTGRFDPAVVAVFAAVVCAAGAARPSLWFDEAATISASTRSVPELWRLIHNIDAVHGLYYLAMHGWFAIFPETEFWSRLSSCLAVGIAAAGVVVVAKQFSTRTVSVCAGIVFAILPRVTWAGIEARSYALTAAAAVWLTVLAVAAVRRNAAALWPLYGLALVMSTLLNVFVVLMVLVHGVVVLMVADKRATVARWAATSTVALLVVAPFLAFCRTQIAQVRWISPIQPGTVVDVVQEQYFDHSVPFALLTGVMLATPLVLRRPWESGNRQLAVFALAWIAVPTAVLLLYSVVQQPIYYPRYLCYTSPAMALLIAVCIVALVRTRERVTAVLAAFALAATPNYLLSQRGPYAKEGMDFSQVADVITAHASAGDCLILDNTTTWKPGPIRPLTAARPAAYEKLVDPGRGLRAPQRNRLWDAHLGIWGVADRVQHCTVLWTVSERDPAVPDHQSGPGLDPGPRLKRAPAYEVPQRMGFHIVERWQFSFAQVVKSVR